MMTITFSKRTGDVMVMLMGLMFFVLGVGVLLYSVAQQKNYLENDTYFIETSGYVIGYDYNPEKDLNAIIVQYNVDGDVYTIKSSISSRFPKDIGSEVQIKYNPNDPADAIILKDGIDILVLCVGGAFAIVGGGLFVKFLKQIITEIHPKKVKDE